MNRSSVAVLTLSGLLAASVAAAQVPTQAPPAAPTAVPSRQRPTQPPSPPTAEPTAKPAQSPTPPRAMAPDPAQQVNVRVELTITESPATGTKKTVTLMTSGGRRGSIRSTLQTPGANMRLSVDASPTILKDGRIALDLIFDYTPEQAQPPSNTIANLNEQMTIYATEGKPVLISQSADPKGDRKVTVEVTATVVK